MASEFKELCDMYGLSPGDPEAIDKLIHFIGESDDDEEFENIDIDKYVDLNKAIHMSCAYNYRFKKWVPMEVCERNRGKLSTLYELNEFKHSNK